MKFRKKPVVIEAVQWFKMGDHPLVVIDEQKLLGTSIPLRTPIISTLEGDIHQVSPGDWVITVVKGEHYPCKPDIFAATYEPVDDSALAQAQPSAEQVREACARVCELIEQNMCYFLEETNFVGKDVCQRIADEIRALDLTKIGKP